MVQGIECLIANVTVLIGVSFQQFNRFFVWHMHMYVSHTYILHSLLR